MTGISTDTLFKRFWYAVLIAAITVSLATLIAVIFQTWFNDPPVEVHSLDKPSTHAICPGDVLQAKTQIDVSGPVLIFSYFSVMDETQNHNINGTQIPNGARPHPHEASFVQMLDWTVPDLPPGKYVRELAFRGTDGRENSLFLAYPFEIGVDCK